MDAVGRVGCWCGCVADRYAGRNDECFADGDVYAAGYGFLGDVVRVIPIGWYCHKHCGNTMD